MGLTHVEAKEIVDRALPDLTPAESLAVRCVAVLETNYGAGWKRPGSTDSLNWGAITGTYDGQYFEHEDSRNDGGTVVKYTTKFKKYPSHEAAAVDLARVMLKPNVRAACASGDFAKISVAMRENRYYLGVASTMQGQIAAHQKRMAECKAAILKATGEPDPFVVGSPGVPASESEPSSSDRAWPSSCSRFAKGLDADLHVLRLGSRGSMVVLYQRLIQVEDDGDFGPLTEGATKRLQAAAGIDADGVVGPDTWSVVT